MASLGFTALLLCLSSIAFLQISPSHSLTCTLQKFTNNKLYTNCTDLPTLSAYLHWEYNPSNSSISIAFVAPPAQSNGWVSWAINPYGTGMAGSQSLIAFKQSDGSMTVNTYNISSYSSVMKSKLSFDVSSTSAEYSGGVMTIFATIALPAHTSTVNQVWQVGGSVTGGSPDRHELKSENLNAKGVLDLVNGANSESPSSEPSPAAVPVPSPVPGGQGGSGNNGSGVSRIRNRKFVIVILLFLASF